MKPNIKYEFTGETTKINIDRDNGGDGWYHTLRRIRRLSDGKLGGWLEKESNLSHKGNCWVDNNAMVYDNARVSDDAQVYNYAKVYDHAKVCDSAKIYGNAKVFDNACVCNNAHIHGKAQICNNATVHGYVYINDDHKVYDTMDVFSNETAPIGCKECVTITFKTNEIN